MSYFTDGNVLYAADLNDFNCDTITLDDNADADIIDLDKSGSGEGICISIINAGTSPTITCDNTGSGRFIVYLLNGSTMFRVYYAGSMDMYNNEIDNINYIDMRNKTSAPTAAEGKIYYDSTDNILKFYNGTAWVILR